MMLTRELSRQSETAGKLFNYMYCGKRGENLVTDGKVQSDKEGNSCLTDRKRSNSRATG